MEVDQNFRHQQFRAFWSGPHKADDRHLQPNAFGIGDNAVDTFVRLSEAASSSLFGQCVQFIHRADLPTFDIVARDDPIHDALYMTT